MIKREIWIDEVVRAKHLAKYTFQVLESQPGFTVGFDGSVREEGKDLHFMLMLADDYMGWDRWRGHASKAKRDAAGDVVKDAQGYTVWESVPAPEMKWFVDVRSNLLKEEVPLKPGTYTLVLDNGYSSVTDKSFSLHVVERWNGETPAESRRK